METQPETKRHERELVYKGDVFVEETRAGISAWSIALEGVQEAEELKNHVFEGFPARLLSLRKAFRQTQAGMAALIGIKEKTYQNWEQGIRAPRGPARRLLNLIFRVPQIAVMHLQSSRDQAEIPNLLSDPPPTVEEPPADKSSKDVLLVERTGTEWAIRKSGETEPISVHRARDEAVIRSMFMGQSESFDVLIRLTE